MEPEGLRAAQGGSDARTREQGRGRSYPKLTQREQDFLELAVRHRFGSRSEVARLLGKSKQTVSAWALGKQGISPADKARLEALLEQHAADLRSQLPPSLHNAAVTGPQPDVATHDANSGYASRAGGVLDEEHRGTDAPPTPTPAADEEAGAGRGTFGQDSVRLGAPGSADPAGKATAGSPVGNVERREVWAYPQYVLWERIDPRDQDTQTAALAPGRRRDVPVGEITAAAGPPETTMAIYVADNTLANIGTPVGIVQAGWTVFVDRRRAAQVGPGHVAAAVVQGKLSVGWVVNDEDGHWFLEANIGERLPLRQADILGEAVYFWPPGSPMAWHTPSTEDGQSPAGREAPGTIRFVGPHPAESAVP